MDNAATAPHGNSVAEACVWLSDPHFGEGATISVSTEWQWSFALRRRLAKLFGMRPPEARINIIPNPIEDFADDSLFANFLGVLRVRYAECDELTLRIGGDWLDLLAVRWRGGFSDPLTERVSLAKVRKIVTAHRVAFDALADFLKNPRIRLILHVGNHDQALLWPRVQRFIIRRLCGRDVDARRRVRFVDHRHSFRDVKDGVAYDHGMNMEAHNAIDPRMPVIREKYGVRLKEPVLNEPPASYMCRSVASPIRCATPVIGRVNRTTDIWWYVAVHDLLGALSMALAIVWFHIGSLFDPRKRFSPMKTVQVVRSTLLPPSEMKYAMRVAEETGADVVVMGHTHDPKFATDKRLTYINSGTWALQHAFDVPAFPRTWKRLRWLERLWHAFLHFLRHRESRISRQAAKLAAFAMFVWMSTVFLVRSFPEREWGAWAERFSTFKLPLLVLLCLAVASAVLRLVSVKPHVRAFRLCTFVLVTKARDGTMDYDLCEFVPESATIKKFI